ncbi:MAG: hypothetical protein ABIZ81_07685 [Opitutaceae bacterium]
MNAFPKLSFACPIPWENLSGDERARFCERCGRTITNLSELNHQERAALLATAQGELCVTYYRRLSGEFVTPERPLTTEERSHIKQLGRTALSAGALVLAAGCMSTEPSQVGTPSGPSAPTHALPATPRPLTESEKLARYDGDRNGTLESAEIAAMDADLTRGRPNANREEEIVLQPFGIVAKLSPAQLRRWIDRELAEELRGGPDVTDSSRRSPQEWREFWQLTVAEWRNPRQIGGRQEGDEALVRYLVSQRRKLHLPPVEFNAEHPTS